MLWDDINGHVIQLGQLKTVSGYCGQDLPSKITDSVVGVSNKQVLLKEEMIAQESQNFEFQKLFEGNKIFDIKIMTKFIDRLVNEQNQSNLKGPLFLVFKPNIKRE